MVSNEFLLVEERLTDVGHTYDGGYKCVYHVADPKTKEEHRMEQWGERFDEQLH